jgi:hypothetical protein
VVEGIEGIFEDKDAAGKKLGEEGEDKVDPGEQGVFVESNGPFNVRYKGPEHFKKKFNKSN